MEGALNGIVLLPVQMLASVAAMLQDAPAFKNREGNFAADAVNDAAPDDALQLPSEDGDAAADDADNRQVGHFTTRAPSVRHLVSQDPLCYFAGFCRPTCQ